MPYAERGAYLLEADLGVSLHPDGVETRYAFRSRLLDCLWAGLPVRVSTGGDALAERVAAEGLGRVVAPGDEDAVVAALLDLLAEPDLRATLAPRFARVAATLTWDRAVAPLAAYCRAPRPAVDHAAAPAAADRQPPARAKTRSARLRPRPAPPAPGHCPRPGQPPPAGQRRRRRHHLRRAAHAAVAPAAARVALPAPGRPRRLRAEMGNYVRWLRARRLSAR